MNYAPAPVNKGLMSGLSDYYLINTWMSLEMST